MVPVRIFFVDANPVLNPIISMTTIHPRASHRSVRGSLDCPAEVSKSRSPNLPSSVRHMFLSYVCFLPSRASVRSRDALRVHLQIFHAFPVCHDMAKAVVDILTLLRADLSDRLALIPHNTS
jgi:hypothetical protein